MSRRPNIGSQRVLSAADVLLDAIESRDGMNALVPVYCDVPHSEGSARYSLMELVDAMTMLMRMGLVLAPHGARGAGRHGGPSRSRGAVRIERRGESRRLGSGADPARVRRHGPRTAPASLESSARPDSSKRRTEK
jgi:hypothetical protein